MGDATDHPEDLAEDLALALGVLEAQLRDAALASPRARWLGRRALGIGCSELPAIWIALGFATPDEIATAREYIIDHSQAILHVKARTRSAPRTGDAARLGRKREPALFKRWIARLNAGVFAHERERAIDPRTVVHVEGHPTLQRLLPFIDRHERRLFDSTDALALTRASELVVVQGKCTGDQVEALPWYWDLQVQGEIAVTDADFGLLVCGEGWASRKHDFETGAFRVWPIARDSEKIAKIRWAVGNSWTRIERYRAAAAASLARGTT